VLATQGALHIPRATSIGQDRTGPRVTNEPKGQLKWLESAWLGGRKTLKRASPPDEQKSTRDRLCGAEMPASFAENGIAHFVYRDQECVEGGS
jgi:hypothetical protein